MVMPSLANRTAVRSVSVSAITRLEPPANTSGGLPSPLRASACPAARSTPTTCSVLVQVMRRRATGPIRNVVNGAKGTASATCAPAMREPAPLCFMALNGSLTCYAAFIRHVRRLPGQRRRGSSGFPRGGILAGQAGGYSLLTMARLESMRVGGESGNDGTIEVVTLQSGAQPQPAGRGHPAAPGRPLRSSARRLGARSPMARRRRPFRDPFWTLR